jgi:hypothetical protein
MTAFFYMGERGTTLLHSPSEVALIAASGQHYGHGYPWTTLYRLSFPTVRPLWFDRPVSVEDGTGEPVTVQAIDHGRAERNYSYLIKFVTWDGELISSVVVYLGQNVWSAFPYGDRHDRRDGRGY